MYTTANRLRTVILRPYVKGMGPVFRLTTWDTNRRGFGGKYVLGYRLTMDGTTVFEGEDFGCSPMHGIDSDETIEGIMAFLTLRPGDTDPEYFASYTEQQLTYCSEHAEALSAEVENRFGNN